MSATLPRSFLYVPGSRPELFAKAYDGPADALVLDLEDAVPPAFKDAAREAVTAWLGGLGAADRTRPEQWVRIDPDHLEADLDAAVTEALDGVFLAKCTLASLHDTAEQLGALEAERRPGSEPVPVVGLLESAGALADLAALAAHPRLTTVGIGEADLLGELRMARSEATAAAVDAIRLQVVMACAAAGCAAPVAPTSTAFRDLDAFRTTTRHLRDLGFRSRTAVHPGQLPVIHDVLTPGADEVAGARDVLERFDAAQGGVTVDAEGRMVDAATVRTARETLARHQAADRRSR